MNIDGVGIDTIEISKFTAVLRKKGDHFIERTFSKKEQKYCYSYSDPAIHFAGTFAAKEAVQKALEKPLFMRHIEIRRLKSGKPEVWLKGRRSKSVLISISHDNSRACAVALRQ